MPWTTPMKSYRDFRHYLQQDAELIAVEGFLDGSHVYLTLATLLEVKTDLYVRSDRGGWIARVFLDKAHHLKPRSYPVRYVRAPLVNPSQDGSSLDDPPWET